MGRIPLVVALILLAVPVGAAQDPVNEPVCDEAIGCVGVGTCVETVCLPRVCDPNVECASDIGGSRSECAENVTIDGTTCSTSVGAAFGTRRQTSVPVVGDVGENGVAFAVVATDGHVFAQNLPNTWIAPAVESDGTLAGRRLGSTSVGLYRSDITVDGQGPLPQTPLTPGHQFSQIALEARNDGGPAGSHEIVIGLILLDLVPESCFARSTTGAIEDVTCPRADALA